MRTDPRKSQRFLAKIRILQVQRSPPIHIGTRDEGAERPAAATRPARPAPPRNTQQDLVTGPTANRVHVLRSTPGNQPRQLYQNPVLRLPVETDTENAS